MDQQKNCECCQVPYATLNCGLCQTRLCKSCAVVIDENTFPFLSEAPLKFRDLICCSVCFQRDVEPEIEKQNEVFSRAKEVVFYEKDQGKETRLIKRKNPPVHVKDVADREEAILRLAFRAALADCNALVDVELKSQKFHHGGYQTTVWSGQAIPVALPRH